MLLEIIDKLAGKWLDWRMGRLTDKLNQDNPEMKLKKLEIGDTGFEAIMEHPAIPLLANEAAALLEASNAKNYIQFDLMPRIDRGIPVIRVTVEYAHGESPANKNIRLEKEIAELREKLNER